MIVFIFTKLYRTRTDLFSTKLLQPANPAQVFTLSTVRHLLAEPQTDSQIYEAHSLQCIHLVVLSRRPRTIDIVNHIPARSHLSPQMTEPSE